MKSILSAHIKYLNEISQNEFIFLFTKTLMVNLNEKHDLFQLNNSTRAIE